MRFKADEIVSVLTSEIQNYRGKADLREVGQVLEVGDGIARVFGLGGIMAGEMVEFPRTGVTGLAFNLEETSVGVIILDDYKLLAEGDECKALGTLLRVPVGEALIGRVVDPLGVPLDGKGPIVTSHYRLVESPAPGVAARQPVEEPMQTGIKAIDAMTPIGRGQRELIIGDLRLCCHWPKRIDCCQDYREPAQPRCDGLYHCSGCRFCVLCSCAIYSPLCRVRNG